VTLVIILYLTTRDYYMLGELNQLFQAEKVDLLLPCLLRVNCKRVVGTFLLSLEEQFSSTIFFQVICVFTKGINLIKSRKQSFPEFWKQTARQNQSLGA